MGTSTAPYAWDTHLATWLILIVGIALVVGGHRRIERRSDRPIPWTRRQIYQFSAACVAAIVALTWPVANLAAHWSLTALVLQRVILVLAVAPLLLLGLPYDVIQWLSRPPFVDAILTKLQRPQVAIVVVTTMLVGSMAPPLVHAQSVSVIARGLLDLAMVVAGLILWLPVLGRVPGILRLTPVVRFVYLIAQAVVPAFLSFLFIFSTRPLYPAFARSHEAIDLRPLNDQQVAGFVSKLSMLLVLLTVGAVVLARAPTTDEEIGTTDPLVWADVERQFERADRRSARKGTTGHPVSGPQATHLGPDGKSDDSPTGHKEPGPDPLDLPPGGPEPGDPGSPTAD
jgi:cytochrome c oxidase assembly factor CtaG